MARNPIERLDSPAAKILAVLSAIARHGTVSVSELGGALGLPVATAHRICAELQRLGYVQRLPGSRQWTVGRPLVDVAANVLAAAAGHAVTDAILQRLTGKIGEMCSLAVQVGDDVVYVASTEAPHAVTLSFRAGRRAPLFCTSSGRLFLARLTDEALASYFARARLTRHTRYTTVSPRKLMAEILRVRRQAYAITRQEYVLHVVGAAVPIERDDGMLYGALSVAAPDVRMNLTALQKAVPLLRAAARELAQEWR
jgi:IclR family transcriptional regulator, acetate operon repressor